MAYIIKNQPERQENSRLSLKPDCLLFRGDKPCPAGCRCEACEEYRPYPVRILIIKCRAQGDVLRTTAILPALKRKYPECFVAWVVDEESLPLLAGNPLVDRLHAFDLENSLSLPAQKFDILISLDKEPGPTALAARIPAVRKLGFGISGCGSLTIFNPASEYAFRLGVDDDLKFFHNRKTYQEIIHEAAELPYARDEYVFVLPDDAGEKAARFFKRHRVPPGKHAIGLNTGAGAKFTAKQWPLENFVRLASLLTGKFGASVFLLGGPRESDFNRAVARRVRTGIYDTGTDNTIPDFAGFLSRMDAVVSSDTLGMHLAIALKKKVVALFGPTCPQEIDLYERGVKLFAGADCAPCYRPACPDTRCMKAITPEAVFKELRQLV
jgi:ADP-heptose:LPS heptosyltransferase